MSDSGHQLHLHDSFTLDGIHEEKADCVLCML